MFPSVEGMELVEQAKLLGVILQDNFSVNCQLCVNSVQSENIFAKETA